MKNRFPLTLLVLILIQSNALFADDFYDSSGFCVSNVSSSVCFVHHEVVHELTLAHRA